MPTVVTDIFESHLRLVGIDTYAGGMRRAASSVGVLEQRLDRLNAVSTATGVAALGIAGGLGKAVQAAGRMQQLEIGFTTLLGSAEAARAKIAELQQFAESTPFEFEGVVKGTQGLVGAGLDVGKTIPVMQALGNVLSANGKSSDDFNESLRQIAQIISAGKLQGDELNILSERGLPRAEIIKAVGKQAGITADEFVAALLKIGNSAKYGAAMENQSKTLFVAISNLHDAAFRLGTAVGAPLVGPLTTVTKWATDAGKAFTELSPPVQTAVSWLGVGLVGVLGLASLATKALAIHTVMLMNAQLRGATVANQYANAQNRVALLGGLGGRLRGAGGRFGRGGVIGTIAGVGMEIAAQALGPDSELGKGLGVAGGAILGAQIGRLAGPWGMLAGGLIGGGYAAWQNFGPQGKDQAAGPKSKQSRTDQLLESIDTKLGMIHSDLQGGVGSSDVVDVMGEARTLRLLAGRIAG